MGIFIIRCSSSGEMELPFLTSELVFESFSQDVGNASRCLSFWRRYRALFGYPSVRIPAVRACSGLEDVLIVGKSPSAVLLQSGLKLAVELSVQKTSVYDQFKFPVWRMFLLLGKVLRRSCCSLV